MAVGSVLEKEAVGERQQIIAHNQPFKRIAASRIVKVKKVVMAAPRCVYFTFTIAAVLALYYTN